MDKIDELLSRGVANVIPGRDELKKLLSSGKKLKVYCGFDVTAPHLHIGNAVPMRKLQQFVDLGHEVTFLIGDFTTLIGDTSDKEAERPVISEEDIEANWTVFAQQAGKILDLSKITVKKNSEWLSQLGTKDLIKIMRRFSLNDFISRELIKKRLSSGSSINLAEVIYPVLQGYDSYFMDMDIQVGGTDQTFNMQAGRALQKQIRDKDSFVMSFVFLTGTDGRKMSKSWGNAIWLDDSPNDMYGKVMSIKDELIEEYFTLGTSIEVPTLSNPLQDKKKLAHQIVLELYGQSEADTAQTYFESTVQQGQMPVDVANVQVSTSDLLDVLVETKLASSKSEARRLLDQNAVKVNEARVTDPEFKMSNDDLLQVGPRKFVKIKI